MNSSSAVAMFIEESENEEELLNYRAERRFLRQRFNIMAMSNKKFEQSFRVSKQVFLEILEEIRSEFPPRDVSSRGTKIPLSTKLGAVLNFYATGSYQRTIGDVMLHSMDQSMISRAIDEITCALEKKLCPKWIHFISEPEKVENKRHFYEKHKIPGIIGCIDGTHVEILAPTENEHLFVDRRGNHSLNVQLICGYNLKIFAVNARFPGSTHDAAIWNMSAEREKMEKSFQDGERNTWLLGDSGYPLEKWLITPFKNPSTEEQRKFNFVHSQGRNAVERCNGVLKGTFRCILGERKLRYEPKKAIRIINVCCALLNICIANDIELLEEYMDGRITADDFNIDETNLDFENHDNEEAVGIRQRLMEGLP